MALQDQLELFVLDLLPDGPFWSGIPGERFAAALAGAHLDVSEFIAGLRDAIFPGTAGFDVLVQWWEYLARLDCLAMPTDTEELRAAILAILGGTNGWTPNGLASLVAGFLPLVVLTESLPVSWIPSDVPFLIDPSGRVLQVWYSPLFTDPAVVECVVRAFARGADELRILTTELSFVRTTGYRADAHAFFWSMFPLANARIQLERYVTSSTTPAETVVFTPTDETGSIAFHDLFPLLNDSDTISGQRIDAWLEYDWGAGFVQATETVTITSLPVSNADMMTVFGLQTAHIYLFDQASGALPDQIGLDTLDAVGTPQFEQAGPGDRVHIRYDGGDTDAHAGNDATVFDITTGESIAFLMAARYSHVNFGRVLGKTDPPVRYRLITDASDRLVFSAFDNDSNATASTLTSPASGVGDNAWHGLAVTIENANTSAGVATELGAQIDTGFAYTDLSNGGVFAFGAFDLSCCQLDLTWAAVIRDGNVTGMSAILQSICALITHRIGND